MTQLVPLLQQGQIDTIFLPDRATAPSFANLLNEAGIAPGSVQLVGSADWDGDPSILNTTTLAGAVFPAVDDAGYNALLPEYQAKYGSAPHKLATIAYTATILANAGSLANATPRYNQAQLTLPAGFNGRDGVFRFLPNGRSEYALVIKQVAIGWAKVAEAAKLVGLGLRCAGLHPTRCARPQAASSLLPSPSRRGHRARTETIRRTSPETLSRVSSPLWGGGPAKPVGGVATRTALAPARTRYMPMMAQLPPSVVISAPS